MSLTVTDVMGRHPKTIEAGALAANRAAISWAARSVLPVRLS